MARRRGRSIDRAYNHDLVVKPIIAPRSTWQDDKISPATRAIADAAQEPLAEVIVSAVVEGLQPEPDAPPPKRPRKVKPTPPTIDRLIFSPVGELLGVLHVPTGKFTPHTRGATNIFREMRKIDERQNQ